MRNIPPLYHWSPSANRSGITREGLQPTCPSGARGLAVCLGSSPLDAWALVPRVAGVEYDLWQVHLEDTPVQRRRHWGRLAEWRVFRMIHRRGVVLVGTRVAP